MSQSHVHMHTILGAAEWLPHCPWWSASTAAQKQEFTPCNHNSLHVYTPCGLAHINWRRELGFWCGCNLFYFSAFISCVFNGNTMTVHCNVLNISVVWCSKLRLSCSWARHEGVGVSGSSVPFFLTLILDEGDAWKRPTRWTSRSVIPVVFVRT